MARRLTIIGRIKYNTCIVNFGLISPCRLHVLDHVATSDGPQVRLHGSTSKQFGDCDERCCSSCLKFLPAEEMQEMNNYHIIIIKLTDADPRRHPARPARPSNHSSAPSLFRPSLELLLEASTLKGAEGIVVIKTSVP